MRKEKKIIIDDEDFLYKSDAYSFEFHITNRFVFFVTHLSINHTETQTIYLLLSDINDAMHYHLGF